MHYVSSKKNPLCFRGLGQKTIKLGMVRSVRSYSLLKGARGTTPAKIEQIEETLLRLSQLACEYPHVCELDINPLMISETTGEAVAVDARIRIAK